ncbi:hypothetical protein DIE15_35645 [Burkholderia sp. Bp9031]|nr:hypothetical protein DIE15_35645 [Burkholderia sp. Bp9031]
MTNDQFVDFFRPSAAECFGFIIGNMPIHLTGLSLVLCLKEDEVSMWIDQFVVLDQCFVSCLLVFEAERRSQIL